MRQHRRCNRPHAACGPRHQYLSLFRGQAVVFQRNDRQHRRQARRAHRHRLTRGQPLRQRHQPVGLDPGAGGVAAPMRLAHTPAGQYDPVAGGIAGIVRRLDHTGKVDARNMRISAHQPAAGPKAQAVLVVQRGIFNRNRDIARGQTIIVQALNRCRCRAAVVFFHHQCREHPTLFLPDAQAFPVSLAEKGKVFPCRPIPLRQCATSA